MGGRGAGKTMAGAEWGRGLASQKIGPIALVGESITEAIAAMVRGPNGLMAVTPPDERPKLSEATLYWPNGFEGMLPEPTIRSGSVDRNSPRRGAMKWEMAACRGGLGHASVRAQARGAAAAIGDDDAVADELLKRLWAEPTTVATKMPTATNSKHLAPTFLSAVVARYQSTVLGRQEPEGQLIDDLPGVAVAARDVPGGRRRGAGPDRRGGRSAGDAAPLQRLGLATRPHPLPDLVARLLRRQAIALFISHLKGFRMTFLSDYKTYIVATVMILTGIAGLVGADIPSFTWQAPGNFVIEALAFLFLRRGLKTGS